MTVSLTGGGRYLVQGNVRLVGAARSSSGRMEARAVLRLLLRSDTMTAVLYMEDIYYSSNHDAVLEEQVSKWFYSVGFDRVSV